MGPVIITLFLVAVLIAEHYLADIVYETNHEWRTKEYVRRHRISFKVDAIMMITFVWVITLSDDLHLVANQLFYLILIVMACLGIWTMLGSRIK